MMGTLETHRKFIAKNFHTISHLLSVVYVHHLQWMHLSVYWSKVNNIWKSAEMWSERWNRNEVEAWSLIRREETNWIIVCNSTRNDFTNYSHHVDARGAIENENPTKHQNWYARNGILIWFSFARSFVFLLLRRL